MGASLQRQKEVKKHTLVQATYELFLEIGTTKSSIDEIVWRANVAKGTF